MSDVILYVDRSRVLEGRLAELEGAMRELVAFVEEHEPRILSYDVYFDPAGERMTVTHLHADSDSLAYHMDVAGPEFPPIGAFIELEAIDVYGQPGHELVRQLEGKAETLGTGTVAVHDRLAGLERLPAG